MRNAHGQALVIIHHHQLSDPEHAYERRFADTSKQSNTFRESFGSISSVMLSRIAGSQRARHRDHEWETVQHWKQENTGAGRQYETDLHGC